MNKCIFFKDNNPNFELTVATDHIQLGGNAKVSMEMAHRHTKLLAPYAKPDTNV